MSFRDGAPYRGAIPPYTVWLNCPCGVVGVDYRTLNKYIRIYNAKRYSRYFEFWPWFSYGEFHDADYISGFSSIWNAHNVNMEKVIPIV